MMILLYGPDNFRSRQKLNEIINQYQKVRRSGFDLFDIDFKQDEPTGLADFQEKISTGSIFSKKKLIIVRNLLTDLFLSKKVLQYFKKDKKAREENIIVFFQDQEFAKSSPLFLFLQKQAKVQEFKFLSGRFLIAWIKNQAQGFGIAIDQDSLAALAQFLGKDLWRLANEIKKLAALKKGGEINLKDLEFLTDLSQETNIFKTIEAIASLDRRLALKMINQHLENGDSPIYLLSMVGYQFRNILVVKDLLQKNASFPVILKNSGLSNFVARKCSVLANKFTFQRLKTVYAGILETDLKIKTGKINPRQGLEMLVVRI